MVIITRVKPKPKVDPDFEYELDDLINRLTIEDEQRDDNNDDNENQLVSFQQPFEAWFPIELLPLLLSFVRDTRILLTISMTSKVFRNAITSEMVIRSAILGDVGVHKTAVVNIMEAVEKQVIIVPSTMRLLRLVLGTKCERMDQCYQYNLKEKVSGIVKHGKRYHGLCICTACSKEIFSSNFSIGTIPGEMKELVDRALFQNRMLRAPHFEYSTKEQAGSLLFAIEFKQAWTSCSNLEERKQALEERFAIVEKNSSECELFRNDILVDAFLTAQGDVEVMKNVKLENKRKHFEEIYSRIEVLLEDYEHKDAVLAGRWIEKTGVYEFSYSPSCEILGYLFKTLRPAKQERIIIKVQNVCAAYDTIFTFFDKNGPCFFSFLEDSTDDLDAAIYKVRNRLTRYSHTRILEWPSWNGRSKMLQNIQNGNYAAALLPTFSEKEVIAIFVFTTVKQGQENYESYEALATAIWNTSSVRLGFYYRIESYRTKFTMCSVEYQSLSKNMKEYMQRQDVQTFLADTGESLSREIATLYLYQLRGATKELLQNQRYDDLFAYHKSVFLIASQN